MLHMGFANIGSIREEIQRLQNIKTEARVKRGRKHKITVEHRLDIDPTEESNALSWGDN